MFVQTEITPNPNSLKFLPGKNVSNNGSFEITQKDQTNNELVKNLLSINGVEGIFLGKDFISINKYDDTSWDEIKHIVISLINDFYSTGKECVVENTLIENNENLDMTIGKFSGKNFSEFKENLSQVMVDKISPISSEIKKLLGEKKYLDKILLEGTQKADKIASEKVKKIQELVGF